METNRNIQTETGIVVPTISRERHQLLLSSLEKDYGILPLQIVEAASFSLAMVVRFALGLSAERSRICVLANESLAGAVALTAARHIVINGGDAVVLVTCGAEEKNSQFLEGKSLARSALNTLETLGVPFQSWDATKSAALVQEVFQECHNVICGLFDYRTEQEPFEQTVVEALNEVSTPIHCVTCPLGVEPDSGISLGEPLFASSTLSLGLPLHAALESPDNLGRHYLCDISIPGALRETFGLEAPPLFPEQPVCKLLLHTPEEDSEEST
ncbi:MAG: hypothetical protein KDD64_06130 [Bdellovibrionales bacterium]|nr:hypothetical protein [Bdellovibrionales bacterium]